MVRANPQKSVVWFRALVLSVLMVLALFPGVTAQADEAEEYSIYASYDESLGTVKFFIDVIGFGEDEVTEEVAAGEIVYLEYYPEENYKVESVVFGEYNGGVHFPVTWHENERIENGQFVMPAHDVYIRIDFVPIDPSSISFTFGGVVEERDGYYITDACIGCRRCVEVCPQSCIAQNQLPLRIEQHHCLHCGNCLTGCPISAVEKRLGQHG